ncbi:MAG: aminotransferase class I/II-fold pyridoxal phosphate-dependent enzyme [Alphaproteobacteria bacterium]|nr:aminotransferase class I/II-fold pyridoxal phosphate-dependent enzyme [Alphaproteobacteria bacterium]
MPAVTPKQGISQIKSHMVSGQGEGLPPVSIALNSNESAFGPSPLAVAAFQAAASGLERYLENPASLLAPALAESFGLDADRITIGQGSDDLLARLARAYLDPDAELLRSVNGYLKIPNYAHANNARPVAAADNNLTASVDHLLAAITERTRIVYLANPENPAGTYLSGSEIRRLHAGLPDNVLLVLDCAYEEYVDAPDYEPGHRLAAEADNVVMTRTFSKIFGMAGARVGWMMGPPAIIDIVNRIGLTFPVATASVAAARAALEDTSHLQYVFEENRRLRQKMTRSLSNLGLKVYPSQTNFVLLRFDNPDRTAANAALALRRQGIAVRRFASPAYNDCIRMTLGHESELNQAQQAIARYLEGGA